MRKRLIPVNVIIVAGISVLLSMGPDQSKPPKEVMERGKSVFEKEWLGRQHADGAGVNGLHLPIAASHWAMGPKTQVIKMVLYGSMNVNEKNGDSVDHHPGTVQSYLTDQEIADALTYVRNSFGNKAVAVTPGEVKKVRAAVAKKK